MDNCQLADGTARLCSELRQPNVLIPCKLLSEDGTVISENGERLQLNDGETIYLPTDSVKLLDEAEETYHSASEVDQILISWHISNGPVWKAAIRTLRGTFAFSLSQALTLGHTVRIKFQTPKNSRKIIALKTNPRNFTDCDKFMLRYGVKKFGENWKFLLEHFVWSVPWMEEDLEAEWNDIKDEQS